MPTSVKKLAKLCKKKFFENFLNLKLKSAYFSLILNTDN